MKLTAAPAPDRRIVVLARPEVSPSIVDRLVSKGITHSIDVVHNQLDLDRALQSPVSLVLASDQMEPGYERLLEKLGNTPLVIYGGKFDESLIERALASGAADWITEDQLGRLAAVVKRELGRAEETADHLQKLWLYERLVDSIPFVLFVKDAKELRLQVVNKTFADAFNTSKDWLLGKLDHDYFPKEQADSFIRIDRGVLESKEMLSFEEVARSGVEGSGEDRVYATRKFPLLDDDGNAIFLIGITEDITARKQAENQLRAQRTQLDEANEQLQASMQEVEKNQAISARSLASYQQRALQMELIRQQNEDLDRFANDLAQAKRVAEEKSKELETAARLRSEFLANFSHEIRTPLNGIIGYADLLMREEGSRLTPHGRRDLNVIKANARTLLALINDILDLSKIESGFVDVVTERVNVTELVDECTATVREYLKGKAVDIHTNVVATAREITTDGLKLRQILLNLLSNAAKFTEAGEIVLDIDTSGSGVIIKIEDTGVGIPQEQLPFVFEKFRQVDGSSTRRAGGTGLGLAIVQELSKVLGGNVEVASVFGRGTTFIVNLPGVLEGVAEKPETPAFMRLETDSQPRVLVVDDDPLIHQLLSRDLEAEGFEVLRAMDGVEALQIAREQRPNAIVLDIHLPRLDGWGVLAEIKDSADLAQIPVILLSVEEQRARGFSLGACEYLVKPVEPQRLVSVVGRLAGTGAGEVLVVDDDAETRELVSRNLIAAGFSVAEARDGDEALLRLRVSPPSLLILDLVMPGRDGFAVLKQARSEGMDLPVVVLTGKDLTSDEQKVLREGMAALVHKGGLALEKVVEEARKALLDSHAQESQKLPRILYVEDSAQNRDVVRRYLQGDFEILEAEDGEHGLERAKKEKPELILMDLSLPRIDGWEATRRLKADESLKRIPVIALTAHASREDQLKAREAGCDDYLTKPVDRDLLVATMRRHLSGRKHV